MIDLSKEINDVLDEYTDEVIEVTNKAINKVAYSSVKKLKTAGDFKDRTGKYRKSWNQKQGKGFMGIKPRVVYNSKHYRLTHLLEYGHATRNGGRARAYPHIEPVEKEGVKELEQEIRKGLKWLPSNNYIKA